MIVDLDLLQAYWLLLLPFPWLWLYWRSRHSVSWPRILPVLSMRYPLLDDLEPITQTAAMREKSATSNKSLYSKVIGSRDQTMAIALSFMILSLTQPVHYGDTIEQEAELEAVDLILLVDTAISMNLSDYEIQGQAVSRLDMLKLFLTDFIKNYSGKRIALVLLGNPPALWLPLTTDRLVVQDALSRISTLLGGRIPDMGASLQLISEKFKNDQQTSIVLISDGGIQLGSISPNEAAKKLNTDGFTLYAIAVGSTDYKMEALDNSSLIYQPADLTILQQVVNTGQGVLFHAENAQLFSDALQIIETKHHQILEKKPALKLTEAWYPLPLSIALFLLVYAGCVQHKSAEAVLK